MGVGPAAAFVVGGGVGGRARRRSRVVVGSAARIDPRCVRRWLRGWIGRDRRRRTVGRRPSARWRARARLARLVGAARARACGRRPRGRVRATGVGSAAVVVGGLVVGVGVEVGGRGSSAFAAGRSSSVRAGSASNGCGRVGGRRAAFGVGWGSGARARAFGAGACAGIRAFGVGVRRRTAFERSAGLLLVTARRAQGAEVGAVVASVSSRARRQRAGGGGGGVD